MTVGRTVMLTVRQREWRWFSHAAFSSHFVQMTKCPEGTKPMLVFAGEAFDIDNEYKRLKSLLIGPSTRNMTLWVQKGKRVSLKWTAVCFSFPDFFRGPSVPAVRLAGLEHVLHFTAVNGKIFMRSYRWHSNLETFIFLINDTSSSKSVVRRSSKWKLLC